MKSSASVRLDTHNDCDNDDNYNFNLGAAELYPIDEMRVLSKQKPQNFPAF